MSIQTLKVGLFLFLGVLVGCSSDGSGFVSEDALEIVPIGASHCETERCGEYPEDACSDWNMSDDYLDGCMLECPRGGPIGPIAARFECNEVHIVSCKELSNVVVEFKDGEHYKYDGIKGHYGTFGAGDKEIVGVWVKAGNNGSGDGPGYGMRFDSDADCGDDGTGGAGGTGGDDDMGGAGGTGGTAGAGGMGGTGGDDCHCSCDDDDDDYDYDDSDDDGYCDDGDSDGDRDCDCDSARDCKVDIECPHGGKYGYIEVEFECNEAHIASCKDLSNVVIEFEDGEHRKYDDLDGHCATLGVGERRIVGVWVKAGNNKSGDGPGYGERFDSDAVCDGTGGTGGAGGMGGEAGMGGMGGMGGEAGMGGMGGAPACVSNDQCPQDGTGECSADICVNNTCVPDDVPAGVTCADGVCDGMGACVECLDANQCPGGGECMVATCESSSCGLANAPDGTSCFDGAGMCMAGECQTASDPISFALDIQPYFEPGMANCVQCHSGGSGFKGVNLDSYANILAGGDNGPLVVSGDSTDPDAILIPKLNGNHNNGPDDAGFVVILSQWIDEGALDN